MQNILRWATNAFAEGLTEKMLIYALGRGIERYDRPDAKQIVAGLAYPETPQTNLWLALLDRMDVQAEKLGHSIGKLIN